MTHHVCVVTAVYLACAWLLMFGTSTAVREVSFAGGLDHDAGTYVWYMWHFKQALLGRHEFLFSDRLFFPVGMNMFRQDWTPVTCTLALPFQWLGPIAAYNLEVWLSFGLCGLAAYLLALKVSGHRAYAFAAGLLFAFCEFRILKACYHGHLTHANQQFIPLFLLCGILYYERRRAVWAVLAGACFFAATFCSPYQMVFLLVFGVLFVLHRLLAAGVTWSLPPRFHGPGLWRAFRISLIFTILSAGTAVALVSPMIAKIGWDAVSLGAGSLSGFIPAFSADLLSYVIPTLGKDLGWPNFTGEGGCAFMGYTTLVLGALSVYAVFRWRTGTGFWLGCALIFFALSLGSVLVVGGQPGMRLPFFAVLEQIPIVRGARVAARFSVLVTLCLGVAGAVTMAALERRKLASWSRLRLWLLRGGLIAVMGYELLGYRVHLAVNMGVQGEPFPVHPIYPKMATETGDFSLLVYPLTWEVASYNIGPLHFPRQYYYYQTIHGKRLVTGFGDAMPASRVAYFHDLPLLDELVRIQRGEQVPPPNAEKREEARYITRLLGIRYILVNLTQVARDQEDAGPRARRTLLYLRDVLETREVYAAADSVVLRVQQDPRRRPEPVTFNRPMSRAHLGNAWRRGSGGGDWYAELVPTGQEDEVLFVQLPRTGARRLTLTLRCTHVASRIRVELEGRDLGEVPCRPAWAEASVPLPDGATTGDLLRLRLRRPGSTGPIAVPVGRTGVSTTARIQVVSRGLRAGNAASVVLGTQDLAPGTRGYNMAVVDPASGEPVLSVAFDLVTDRGPVAAQMQGLLQNIPKGMIVAVAVKDDGSLNLTDGVVSALRTVGASESLRERLRHSYALIGVKGAAPGTAMEQISADGPAVVELGSLLQVRRIGWE